ncbi:MAG: hypothetical protein P4L51_28375 [Puia sp.]|nr:hypothetical protein [Puia sp.]
MTIKFLPTVSEILSVLFIMLFLYTGISKISDYFVFKEQIATSPLLAPFAPVIAGLLPWVEFGVVILLAIPRWRLKGLYASFILMVAFTIYIIAMLTFNKEVPCSCGGVIELLSWNAHIVFNSVFIGLAGIAIIAETKIRKARKKSLTFLTDGYAL